MPPTESPQSTPPVMPTPPKRQESGMGPTIGIIIILVLLAVGAFYFWGHALNQQQPEPPYIPDQSATS